VGYRVDGRSDIFSLGVVFYALPTGRRPFRGHSRAELLEQITTPEPRLARRIEDALPRELERICLRALAKRASERYLTAKDLAEVLRHCLAAPSAAAPSAPAGVGTPSIPDQRLGDVPADAALATGGDQGHARAGHRQSTPRLPFEGHLTRPG
jgi:serine/threonine protein kinase